MMVSLRLFLVVLLTPLGLVALQEPAQAVPETLRTHAEREVAFGDLRNLLDDLVVLIVPQVNPDGGEAGSWAPGTPLAHSAPTGAFEGR